MSLTYPNLIPTNVATSSAKNPHRFAGEPFDFEAHGVVSLWQHEATGLWCVGNFPLHGVETSPGNFPFAPITFQEQENAVAFYARLFPVYGLGADPSLTDFPFVPYPFWVYGKPSADGISFYAITGDVAKDTAAEPLILGQHVFMSLKDALRAARAAVDNWAQKQRAEIQSRSLQYRKSLRKVGAADAPPIGGETLEPEAE